MCTHARVCWYHFANLSTVSVCPPVHTVTQTDTHTHTQTTLKTHANTCQVLIENTSFEMNREDTIHNHRPTQVNVSRYARNIWHSVESVGLHRRYTLRPKIQCTTVRGAGACAHERRTGVVAAEGAVAKGGCPCLRLRRQATLSRCLGLYSQVWHLEFVKAPPGQEILPKQGPGLGPNVVCRLKDQNRYREHTIVRCNSKGRLDPRVCPWGTSVHNDDEQA